MRKHDPIPVPRPPEVLRAVNPRRSWRRVQRFVQHDVWHLPEQLPAGRRSFLLRLARIVVLATRGFAADALQLRASALTYYSLLSVVPAAALAFGIAKGFGLEAALEETLRQRLAGQEVVLDRVIAFSHSLLAETRGGLVAGVGVALLLWSLIRLLGNIEKSFNAIWGVTRPRSAVRKLTDYLAFVIVAPLLLLVSSSATVFISGRVSAALADLGVLEPSGALVRAGLELVPFVFIWLLLSVLYLTMPNTSVSWRAGLAAGVVAGTLYQFLQFGYVQFQVGVSRYNAIYGSFAALPLFLIWVHLSWLIVLVGAEVSFAVDNAGDYARERAVGRAGHHRRRLLALGLTVACARRFVRGEPPPTSGDLADGTGVPLRLVQAVLSVLTAGGVLAEIHHDARKSPAYQPARDPGSMTILDVAGAYDRSVRDREGLDEDDGDGADLVPEAALGAVAVHWRALLEQAAASRDNLTLRRLVENGDA